MNRVIFGGGFNPIHLGHLNMALAARDVLDAQVIFVPAKVAIWKNDSIDASHKLNMLRLAIEDYDGFSIDRFEIDSKEQPYSFETIRYFKKKYPKDRLFLLIGQDQANSFHLWKNPEEIADSAQIIYFRRPKYELKQENIDKYHMQALDGAVVDVSSSDIRELKSIMVPEKVLKYIEDNSIYFINKVKGFMKESRFEHSLSVAHLAYRIAKIHQLDYRKAYIAGILHDIAKDMDKNQSMAMMKQFYPDFVSIGAFAYHQFLGEKLAKDNFEVTDEEILGAIKYHTTGKAAMNWLEKLIYAVDKADPTRDYDSSNLISAMEKGVEEGFLTVLKANRDFLLSKHKDINNRLTDECLKYYLRNLRCH